MVKFGEVVRNVDEYERAPLEAGLERYVGLEHLDPESMYIRRWGLIAEGTSFTRRFRPGQVLFAKRRAYQRKAAMAEFDGICSGDLLVFEARSETLIPEMLPFVVQSDAFFVHALQTSAGSLSPRTRWNDIATYELALPPKEVQQRIAEVLWAADAAATTSAAATSMFEVLRRSAMSELLSRGVGHSKFKSTLVGGIPKSWEAVTIQEIGDVQLGQQRAPKYSIGLMPRPYLRVANVYDGYLKLDDVLEMDFPERDLYKYLLKPGDILLNEGQSLELVGRSAIYNGEIEGCCFQKTLLRFRQVSESW
jgi:type I restriction enzyme S subunit